MVTVNDGKDRNYFKELTVTATAFQGTEDLMINIMGQYGLILENSGAAVVEYSFNGNVLHGRLGATGSATAIKTFNNRRVSKIWFRCVSGSNIVRVEAW